MDRKSRAGVAENGEIVVYYKLYNYIFAVRGWTAVRSEIVAVTRTMLTEGVFLTCLPAQKFKTSVLSAQFVTPLKKDTAAIYSLMPAVLRRGMARYPDMGVLSAELDHLYGAQIDYTIRKKGEKQCVGFVASFLSDEYVPGGEKLLEPVAALLGELICAPATRNGRFVPEYVEGERENLIDAIRSIRNDKRDYASLRLLQEMCVGEPYGVSRLGSEETAAKVSGKKLYTAYADLLATGHLELFYSGSAEPQRVEAALQDALSAMPRKIIRPVTFCQPHKPRAAVRTVTEEMDVTQGKLGMGFSVGSRDFPAILMGNTIFGGSSNSKLFMNVREKLSLCYYASSGYHRQKGLITVSSGVEFANFQKTYDEILTQLKEVCEGRLEDWEMDGARSTLLNAYASMGDSQGQMENFYLGQAATGYNETPEELAIQIRAVTPERVFEAMSTVKLDTVYFLKGKEAAE